MRCRCSPPLTEHVDADPYPRRVAGNVGDRVLCRECGAVLDERSDLPAEERKPCPTCGSTRRTFEASVTLRGTATMSADAIVVRAWDGASLTLFGVIYAIVVTVAGVVVAMVGTGGSWLWWAIYAIVSLLALALALALLVFPQAVIAAMRWLVERAEKAPPWPR